MGMSESIAKYLKSYSVEDKWRLIPNDFKISSDFKGIENVIVIPAFVESKHLFRTLASISDNPQKELVRTLVICVVNNKEGDNATDIADNRDTLKALSHLVNGDDIEKITVLDSQKKYIDKLCGSSLRLAYVDASSHGFELPSRIGGVGLARKIGFDLALTVFDYKGNAVKNLFSLDADTLVEKNYISAVRSFFEQNNAMAGMISFSHQEADNPTEQAAINCYEIFLRYYVLGLGYAGSPYAFHSIGSTMVCTAEGYAAVRGMNKRKAGEDFYFLNKLSKLDEIGKIHTTMVYPSSRPSQRVPFGTGKRVIRFLEGDHYDDMLYDARIFVVLKKWLQYISSLNNRDVKTIMRKARGIHPSLAEFLRINHFEKVWPRLIENSRSEDTLRRHFFSWFDGFKTFKLVNYMTKNSMPRIKMSTALSKLLELDGRRLPDKINFVEASSLDSQYGVLRYMRSLEC